MRTIAFLILLMLTICAFSQQEFAPVGAEWYYSKNLSYDPPKYGYIKLTSIKDSTIHNKNVRVIEVLHVENDTTQYIEGYEYIAQTGDTIWYWKNNDFHLLYNFSMQKGDSILLYSEMQNSCSEKSPYGWNLVDSTFTKEFNGLLLKAYSSVPIKNSIWGYEDYPSCEIIGNLRYLIPQNVFCGVYDIPQDGPLRCYSDPVHGVLVTSLPKVKCDSTYAYKWVNISDISKTGVFSIYPNPVQSKLTINCYDEEIKPGNYEIEIVNINGRTVKNYDFFSETINISDLPTGVYFLIISKNKKQIDYEKFIKK